jgi:hypothetical protein
MEEKLPALVRRVHEAVSQKLGRPASVRQVKNRSCWYVNDPVLSFIQHGMKKGNTGYRVGYMIEPGISEIQFRLVHSPLIAKLFKKHLGMETLLRLLDDTAVFRSYDYIFWDSRRYASHGQTFATLTSFESGELRETLLGIDNQFGFAKDLFPERQNTGKSGGKAPVAGNTFYLLLANRRAQLRTRRNVVDLVDLTWPLMLWLYPQAPVIRRTASLARSMRVAKLERVCEFASIRLPRVRRSEAEMMCDGSLEAAHIKAHQHGGSDRHENGLWLCQKHHRMTEGRLKGSRSRERIAVRYIGEPSR